MILTTYKPRTRNYYNFGDIMKSVATNNNFPSVNITETAENFQIALAVPGRNKEEFSLAVEQDVLKISTQKVENKEETTEKILRQEFKKDSFERSFKLPKTVDTTVIEATYINGVLKITLPKIQKKAPKKIVVA